MRVAGIKKMGVLIRQVKLSQWTKILSRRSVTGKLPSRWPVKWRPATIRSTRIRTTGRRTVHGVS